MSWTEQTGSEILRWSSIASSSDGQFVVACVDYEYIYTSTNYGVDWTPRMTDEKRHWYSVASSSDGTKLVACVHYYGKIWTSTDSGETWTTQMTDDEERYWYRVASSSDGEKLVACVYNKTSDGYIYTSINSGESWTARMTDIARDWTGVASSSDGKNLIACNNVGYLWISIDYGLTWIERKPTEETHNWMCVASSSDGTKLLACDIEYVYISTDSGDTWTPRITDVKQSWKCLASSSDGIKMAAGTSGGRIYISTDSGKNWIQQNSFQDYKPYWSCIASNAAGDKLFATVQMGRIWTYVADEVVTDYNAVSGSLISQFLNNNVIVNTFTTIPGNLDTTMLEDGDYSDPSILDIFEHLKNYSYNDSIFDTIKYKLAAFFSSIAYEQAYVKIINEKLTPLFVSGKITKEEYDIALKVAAKELSDKYPTWYFVNVAKIQKAIVKYKYILNQK